VNAVAVYGGVYVVGVRVVIVVGCVAVVFGVVGVCVAIVVVVVVYVVVIVGVMITVVVFVSGVGGVGAVVGVFGVAVHVSVNCDVIGVVGGLVVGIHLLSVMLRCVFVVNVVAFVGVFRECRCWGWCGWFWLLLSMYWLSM